ncbi:sugar phosphate isomerase/epimerase family protein [Paludisphaera mucosa]|uniref:Sugar phosphate isomerase/epimerase n=1 Tax=Paludisphaera mucosa TaxID=3030827 RepID=A0ABT6FEQ2_9BACT|nr:sugar phosphate isomerase/epimerase family protein [Paludisphaera mucosa]MDG3006051.1 sugar phosphate isomerase/epimerase [Paludisphaera mucosa]
MGDRLSRRTLLGGAAAGALTFCLCGSATAREKAGWKVAIGLNGFQSGSRKYQKNYPIWEVLDFASREKFDGVELVADWPSGEYPASNEAARVRALRRLYDQYGLSIFSIQLGAPGAFDASAEVRRAWLDQFRDRARLARALGCSCVGLWPYGDLKGQSVDQGLAHLAASFREAGAIAADHGLLACFELEPPFPFNTEDHFQRILHGANHPALKGIYDPSHFDLISGATGRPEAMLERVGPANIGYLQFCDGDSTLRDGGTSKHLGCGDGHYDSARSLKILKDGGFRGWIMIDAWEVPDPYDASLKGKRAADRAWREG